MTEISPNEVTPEDLAEWFRTKEELSKLKSKEGLLRAKIVRGYFPTIAEGTNRHALADGYSLKATHEINRTVGVPELQALADQLRAAGVVIEDVIKWKAEVSVSNYRKLTDEQRLLFDQCLTIKPGSTQLEIDKPKKGN